MKICRAIKHRIGIGGQIVEDEFEGLGFFWPAPDIAGQVAESAALCRRVHQSIVNDCQFAIPQRISASSSIR